MLVDKQKNILCGCLDIITLAGFIRNKKEREELADTLITELNHYPLISAKASDKQVVAFVSASSARHILMLAAHGIVPFRMAFALAKTDIETAFGVLADN